MKRTKTFGKSEPATLASKLKPDSPFSLLSSLYPSISLKNVTLTPLIQSRRMSQRQEQEKWGTISKAANSMESDENTNLVDLAKYGKRRRIQQRSMKQHNTAVGTEDSDSDKTIELSDKETFAKTGKTGKTAVAKVLASIRKDAV